MRLFIPPLGTQLRLLQDWTFKLHWEHRNITLFNKLDGKKHHKWGEDFWSGGKEPREVIFPAGTTMKVSRIYIRHGVAGYDSVTFTVPKDNVNLIGAGSRFWVKLADANNMECEVVA